MDPQLKSVLTSILMTGAGALGTFAVSHGVIPSEDATSFANIVVSILLWLITAALGWYKTRQVTPAAAIQQVNAQDNGVKVVPATSPGTPVNAPLK
jgi:hypothetical protein